MLPRALREYRIEFETPADDRGTRRMTLWWWRDGRNRAQCFRTTPAALVSQVLDLMFDPLPESFTPCPTQD
jgi:hypothetical protein